ncbi:hypothetical protein ACU6RU_11300 [Microbacterium sp. F1-18]|uniref:hypothetical protein n=1 Tax=unclassified Microbacterium TaxID=2609290 RepID=UPI000FF7E563|nr:hypothetical protein [Microbacterium sp. AG238]RKE60062.1 hypothetical protein DEU36_2494 [Microbacterium sp. AG238]
MSDNESTGAGAAVPAESASASAEPLAEVPAEPAPELIAALDEAAAASKASPTDAAVQERLWRAAFALDRWLFIARGSDDEPTPFALRSDEGAVIFAFSTADRAHEAALGFGLPEDEASRLLAVPLPSAAAWVASYAEAGVEAMVFDAPANGAMAPLSNLAAMAVYISQNPSA